MWKLFPGRPETSTFIFLPIQVVRAATATLAHYNYFEKMISDLRNQQVAFSTASASTLTYEVQIELVEA